MRILIGIDGSRYAMAAVRFVARHLPAKNTSVHLVHVSPPVERSGQTSVARQRAAARRRRRLPQTWLAQAEARLAPRGFDVHTTIRTGLPGAVITSLAESQGFDLVVVGAKGRSDAPFFDIGSVALAVLEHVPGSVLMVREREPGRREKEVRTKLRPFSVLLPTDGKPHSQMAIRTFLKLFEPEHLYVVAVSVLDHPESAMLQRLPRAERERLFRTAEKEARVWLEHSVENIKGNDVTTDCRVLRGRPAAAIVDLARTESVTLILLGSRGVRRIAELHLGSVALEVARTAPCSVMVVREDALGDAREPLSRTPP